MNSVVLERGVRTAGVAGRRARARADAWPAAIHAVIATALLGAYGAQVCPFLASLSGAAIVVPIGLGFAAWLALRHPLIGHMRLAGHAGARVGRAFVVDVATLVGVGLVIATWNMAHHGFPPGSGLKLVLGFAILGFFIATDLALGAELARSRGLMARGESLARSGGMLSFVNRSSGFALVAVTALAGVVLLALNQDLAWLAENLARDSVTDFRRAVMLEVSFVTLTVAGYFLRVIFSYSRNLRFYFEHQTRALEQATRGVLEPIAPDTTNDELGEVAALTNRMIESLAERTRELELTREVTILTLASLAEARDHETGEHLLRTQGYVRALAEELAEHPRFRHELDPRSIALIVKSAPLHDIGKVGIPDSILRKTTALDPGEMAIMRTHPTLGAEALAVAEATLGRSSFMRHAREIAECHHEKWDGSGYPRGLSGEDIPVSARLMALADVYDALRSARCYKQPFDHVTARDLILAGHGTQFDPVVVDAFLRREAEFEAIARRYQDP